MCRDSKNSNPICSTFILRMIISILKFSPWTDLKIFLKVSSFNFLYYFLACHVLYFTFFPSRCALFTPIYQQKKLCTIRRKAKGFNMQDIHEYMASKVFKKDQKYLLTFGWASNFLLTAYLIWCIPCIHYHHYQIFSRSRVDRDKATHSYGYIGLQYIHTWYNIYDEMWYGTHSFSSFLSMRCDGWEGYTYTASNIIQ